MEEDFDLAESTVSSTREVSLTDAEKQAMRQFCLQTLQLKKVSGDLKEDRKHHAGIVKEKRAKLMEWLKLNRNKCYTLPKTIYKDAEIELSKEGLASVPPYLRLQKNTTDANITPTVAELSIMDVTIDRVLEKKENPLQSLILTIVEGAKTNIRTFKEAIALSDKLERGIKPIELDEVPEDIAGEMIKMHKAAQVCKKKSENARAMTSDTNSIVKTLQPKVAQVLEKCGRSSQQIQLDGVKGMHRIVKSTSARAPKVTLKIFEESVSSVLKDMDLDGSTVESIVDSFTKKRKEIIKRVQLKITKLPKATSSSIRLVSVAEKDESEEEE